MSSKAAPPMSLPSINEMFPVHLLNLPPERRLELLAMSKAEEYRIDQRPSPQSREYHQGFMVVGQHDERPASSRSGSSNDTRSSGPQDQTKKHVCQKCSRRFNRPSSLRIHLNTHTGATPFRCPYPNCGRRFNVSSNMRRHFRKHDEFPPPGAIFSNASNSTRHTGWYGHARL
ncbi:hypothetical protein BT96DRAFT_877998 [Gymnopus androsaceus JB14]|uniref:C2H2-type domain-containing protein n=1 Tax=Gymnopus androsaceus JB14 TaxID=1447944 RepID=A0A6A4I2F9_9AGAR|nr:hypothetical protein BT96DRAFT_877998 [Gymnopus androsaceus JB14]